MVDPGPGLAEHRDRILAEVADARRVHLLVTHHHPDHAEGAPALARALGVPVIGPGPWADQRLHPGDEWETDDGRLVPVPTPGHSPDHTVFHWPEGDAVFVGDLLLGEGETTWVGEYPGCVADYLQSLEVLEDLGAGTLYSAHGPPITDSPQRIGRFREHRLRRIREVAELRRRRPQASPEELTAEVYGTELPWRLEVAALESIRAILHHLQGG